MNEVKLQGAGPVGVWRFGAAVLNEALAELRVAGQPVALDRSSHDVLLALLRHAGEVVTKDELLEVGWPERVVSENSLAKAISRLRTALAGDGEALKSVHGYGYRLAATVVYSPTLQPQEMPPIAQPEKPRKGACVPLRPGWRLIRPLGEGGAGVVWLAESGDGQQRAIKFAVSEADLRCLKREIGLSRYIQAVRPGLPGVAPVLDSNLAEPPFFLEMPYYPCGDLREWAAAQDWAAQPLALRLELFISLCDAVAALHEIGLIHKDLKPENLYPEPDANGHWRIVLSDLGAGEALPSPQLAQMGITLTLSNDQLSPQAGSLMYLAPEVLAGKMPTQRSDVFSLGELLYQFIVGDLRMPLAPGWEEDIDDELLREDIALAAAARPERRMLNALELADRVRALPSRHAARLEERRRAKILADQREQLARLQQRRHWQRALAATLVLGLLGTTGMYLFAEDARRQAEDNASQRQKVLDFVANDILRQANPYARDAGAVTLQQAIDLAAKNVDKRFADAPAVAAAIHDSLGAAYEGMNQFPAAAAQFDRQLTLLQQSPGTDAKTLARAHGRLCTVTQWGEDLEATRAVCTRARGVYVAAGLPPYRPETMLALVDNKQGLHQATLTRLQPLLPGMRASGDDDTYAFALWFAGIAHARLGQHREAEQRYAELVKVRRHQSSGNGSMDVAWALTEHGASLLGLGRDAEGRAELEEAEALFVRIAGKQHTQAQVPKIHLAQHHAALGHWRQALALADAAYVPLRASIGWNDHWTFYAAVAKLRIEAELGRTDSRHAENARHLLADLKEAHDLGQLPERLPYLREPVWSAFAWTRLAQGDVTAARADIERLRGMQKESLGASPAFRAKLSCFDAELALADGHPAQARALAHTCLRLYTAAYSAQSPMLNWPRQLQQRLPATT